MLRKIIHVSIDSLFASVEQNNNPQWQDKPLVVTMPSLDQGVVNSASFEAGKLGIQPGMTTQRALKLCPELVIVQPQMSVYQMVTKKCLKILSDFSELIEPLALDEYFIDVTDNKKTIESPLDIAKLIKQKIFSDLQITISIGISFNKLLARFASDLEKPDGLHMIRKDEVDNCLKNTLVDKIYGISKINLKKLRQLNISTCFELQKFSIVEMINHFGTYGEQLYYFCRGIDLSPVSKEHLTKIITSEKIIPIITNNLKIIKDLLYTEVQNTVEHLTANHFLTKTITIKLRYSDMQMIQRSKTLKDYTDEFHLIFATCLKLLEKTEIKEKKIKLIGVSLSNFQKESEQLELDFG
ncbi:MAG: DNA polymerase IV [Spirochaetes bacterium]|nr:DNA polymerase IV [Spirochaetota bacterium]